MIIRPTGADPGRVESVRSPLGQLVRSWGPDLTVTTTGVPTLPGADHADGKAIDPISAVALVLSIPSAALAGQVTA
jgi:hypothetical protein